MAEHKLPGMRAYLSFGFLCLPGLLCGCATAPGGGSCTVTTVLAVSPASGTADHSAAAPGNQQKFSAVESFSSITSGCAVPLVVPVVYPAWTSSDPVDVTVSSAADSTNGLATCVNAALAPVTLTASVGTGATAQAKTVTLACK